MPDACVIIPHSVRSELRAVLRATVAHGEGRLIGDNRNLDPDERCAITIPSVDFMRNHLARIVDEDEVGTSVVVEVGVSEAGERIIILGEFHEHREIGKRFGGLVIDREFHRTAEVLVDEHFAVGIPNDVRIFRDWSLGGWRDYFIPIDIVEIDRTRFGSRIGKGHFRILGKSGNRKKHRKIIRIDSRQPNGGGVSNRLHCSGKRNILVREIAHCGYVVGTNHCLRPRRLGVGRTRSAQSNERTAINGNGVGIRFGIVHIQAVGAVVVRFRGRRVSKDETAVDCDIAVGVDRIVTGRVGVNLAARNIDIALGAQAIVARAQIDRAAGNGNRRFG